MKTTVLFLTVLGYVLATPSGYYHQEYNYKTSASSYKNNELQHQTDDQGYYKKDGDLEGRVRPRVDANSEHSEYINPNLKTGDYNTRLTGGANGDLSSYGHMRANLGSYGNHGLSSEGLARADHISGTRAGTNSGYSSGSYGTNSYGSSSQSYGASSNLRSVTSHIQQDLERDLQRAVQDNRAYSQSGVSVAELERELRQNLTNRLNAELVNRYGQQSIRGGLSYTISDGRLHSTANYDNQELQDLRTQLENTLVNQLKSQHQSSSHYERQQTSHDSYGYSTTTARPVYYTPYPVNYRPITTIRSSYPSESYIRYTPIPNPESITSIASRVQNQLDARLNELLEGVQRRHFSSSSSYSLTNTDVVLENLRNELRNNITYLLNEDVKVNYGNQIPRDGYMYSVSSTGQTSNQHNYAIQDLENLRSQIERNLIEKLNRDFETYRSRWHQQSAYQQSSNSGSSSIHYGGYSTPRYDVYSTPRHDVYSTPRYDAYSTPRYDVYSTPRYVYSTPRYDAYSTPQYTYDTDVEHFPTRPSSSHMAPLISSGGSSSSNRHYNILAGTSQAGYEVSGGSNNVAQLQRQLQQDLSRQLQSAISRGHYGSYSTSGSYNPQSYQVSLQQLSDELNRNLTKQLQEYRSSGYYSTYGNVDQSQLASLRNQLQTDLMRQLQQGLQQSYHSSSSYSASSSSSSSSNGNYRPVRGFENYQLGQYRSGGSVHTTDGADCVGDDPNAYNSHRIKRSYPPYRSQQLGLGYSGGYTRQNYNSGYSGSYRNVESNYDRSSYGSHPQQESGQEEDESDLTQQSQNERFQKLQHGTSSHQQVDLGQQVDDSDLTQQIEDTGIGKLQLGSQNQHIELGQQVDDSDLTQQVEDLNFGKLQLGSQGQQQVDLGQQVDNLDLTQQVEDSNPGKLQLGSQRQVDISQQTDDFDLTQQVEPSYSGKLELEPQTQQEIGLGQQNDHSDSRQIENLSYGKLEAGAQGREIHLSQQVDDSDVAQQVEDLGYGKLQIGAQRQQIHLGQQVDDTDVTQQLEDANPGELQIGSQRHQQIELGQQVDDSDITQQVEDVNYGKLQLGSQGQQQVYLGQQVDDTDSTQQIHNSGLGTLQIGSHGQHISDFSHQIDNSDSTQQIEDSGIGKFQLDSSRQQQIQLGQEIDNSDLTQQVEDIKLGDSQEHLQSGQQIDDTNFHPKLQLGSYNRQQVQLGESQNLNQHDWNTRPRHPHTEVGQQEDNSDLTQQIEDVQVHHETDDLGQISTDQTGGNRQAFEEIHLSPYFDTKQKEVALQLEKKLSNELKDAVKNHYIFYYSDSHNDEIKYQNLVKELKLNLTKQLQSVGPGSSSHSGYSYSYVFSGPQINLLQKQLESELKLQLQREITTREKYLSQQQNQNQENIFVNQRPHHANSENIEFGQTQTTQEDLTHQQDTFSQNSQFTGQQQTDQSQIEDINRPGQNYFSRPHLSGNIQFGNRPIHRRPSDTNHFIQTEIAQHTYPNQDIISQHNNYDIKPNLPTLNQVIVQQQHEPDAEVDTILPNRDEPLTDTNDLNQQQETKFADDQQFNIDFSSQTTTVRTPSTNNENLHIHNSMNQIDGHIQLAGQSPQSQSLAEAEHNSDLLIQSLREAIEKNRASQSTTTNKPLYTHVFSHSTYGHNSQESGSYGYQNQNLQPAQQNLLNQQQIQLVNQLETDLKKQLQDAVSENYYAIIYTTGTINPHSYQLNYKQLLKELERNITKQFEQISEGTNQNSYNTYSKHLTDTFTEEQKRNLIYKLQTDLSRQLERDLQVTYGRQMNNGQNTFNSESGPREIYGTHGSNSNQYEKHSIHQVNYGQQNVLPDTEDTEVVQPIEPIDSVEPDQPKVSDYNSGVKGRGKYRASLNTAQSVPQLDTVVPSAHYDTEVHQPQSEISNSSPSVPVNSGTGTEEIIEQGEIPQNVDQENLPWWKRVGHKIKQGATSLKEKIIG